jgi:hypothetical protein
VRSSSCRRIRE